MAIVGKASEIESQIVDNALFKKALAFLKTEDLEKHFKEVTNEKSVKVEIEGDKLFAIFQQYNSKVLDKPKFEGHLKYTDIQYVHQGEELSHFASIEKTTTKEVYSEQSDLYFLEVSDYSTAKLSDGDIAVFFPCDMHAPGNAVNIKSTLVKKIVFKIQTN